MGEDLDQGCGGKGRKTIETLDERLEFFEDAAHLRLLEHHLRDENLVGVAGPAPGEVPAVGAVVR